ncbi:MAG: hypothetical protein ACXADY_17715 [Candidatus Hodarchaeales archaeon]|jgi:hypothetical protein
MESLTGWIVFLTSNKQVNRFYFCYCQETITTLPKIFLNATRTPINSNLQQTTDNFSQVGDYVQR